MSGPRHGGIHHIRTVDSTRLLCGPNCAVVSLNSIRGVAAYRRLKVLSTCTYWHKLSCSVLGLTEDMRIVKTTLARASMNNHGKGQRHHHTTGALCCASEWEEGCKHLHLAV